MFGVKFFRNWVIPPKIFEIIINYWNNGFSRTSHEDKKIVDRNSIFKDKYLGKRCFVIGNGPSLNNVDLSLLEEEITIVMNFFHLNPILEKWQPTFYCAADPAESYTPDVLEPMKCVAQKIIPKEGFFFPLPLREIFKKYNIFQNEKTFYLDMRENLEDWDVNKQEIDFTKKMIGVQTTAILGISLAMYTGCKKIYLLGVDTDWLAYQKIIFAPHFYQVNDISYNDNCTNTWKYRQNIEAVLTMFRQYEKIHEYAIKRNIEIINVTENSFLDEFPRAKLEDIL